MVMVSLVSLALLSQGPLVSGLLGAGEGPGSCLAPPFRSDPDNVAWTEGCPDWAPCCSEYGFCQTRWVERIPGYLYTRASGPPGRMDHCSVTAMVRATDWSCL